MDNQTVEILGKKVETFDIPLGSVHIVFVKTAKGMLACSAIDVQILDKFDYPAARVKMVSGVPIGSVQDILDGEIKETNGAAGALGIAVGMSAMDALKFL